MAPRLLNLRTAAAASLCAAASTRAGPGPDVVIADIFETTRWGTRDGFTAYTLGNYSCNLGTSPANWYRDTPNHPVFGQAIYRLKDGRFEQVGQGFVKHAFAVSSFNYCGTCQFPPNPNQQLGVNCADAYTASLNGDYVRLGPKSQVNPFSGSITFPINLTGYPTPDAPIGRRIQVANIDLDPALNPGARYFVEMHIIAADDAAAGNALNNASFREVSVGNAPFSLSLIPGRPTRVGLSAIDAWPEIDPSVVLSSADIPGEGRLKLASKATDLGNGLWRYTYALYNLNSQRAAASLSIPISLCAPTPTTEQRLPRWHSGEPYANTPWSASIIGSRFVWQTEDASANPNASAVRWGTLARFELVTSAPPVRRTTTIGFFEPGETEDAHFEALVPSGSADMDGDGFSDFFDFDAFVAAFEVGAPEADFAPDGFIDFFDFDAYVTAFEQGC